MRGTGHGLARTGSIEVMRCLSVVLVLAASGTSLAHAGPRLARPIELPSHADADVSGRMDTVLRTRGSFSGRTTGLLVELGLAARLRVPRVDAQLDIALPIFVGSSYDQVGGAFAGVPVVGAGAWLCAGQVAAAPVRIFVGVRATFDLHAWSESRAYEDTELLRRAAVYDLAYRPGEVFSANSSSRFIVSARWTRRGLAVQVGGTAGTSNRLDGDEDLDAPRSFVGGQLGGAVATRSFAIIGEGFVTCAGNPCYSSVHLGLRLARAPGVTLHVSHFEGREDYEPGNSVGLRVEVGR